MFWQNWGSTRSRSGFTNKPFASALRMLTFIIICALPTEGLVVMITLLNPANGPSSLNLILLKLIIIWDGLIKGLDVFRKPFNRVRRPFASNLILLWLTTILEIITLP